MSSDPETTIQPPPQRGLSFAPDSLDPAPPRPDHDHPMVRRVHLLWCRRGVRRWALRIVAAGLCAACLLVVAAVSQARLAPQWWRTISRDDPATKALGQRIENSVINRAHQTRPAADSADGWTSEPWTIEVRPEEANAWLNIRLPKWMVNQKDEFRWPKEVTDLQVDFGQGEITIGARVQSGERSQVVSATLRPRLEGDGRLFAPASWVNVGRLPIPADWVLGHAHRNAERYIPPEFYRLPETEALFRAFEGRDAIVQHAVVRLPDGRRVRILALEVVDGVLRMTCRTEMQ